MSSSLDILGIRHHGPGSARAVVRALESVSPACVLIEAPADIPRDVIDLAADQAMQPPVALLIYETENPRESSFLPFSEFSPEWCAIRWALTSKIPLRFMDLPQSHRIPVTKNFAADQKTPEEQGSQAEQADEPPSNSNAPVDPDQVLRLDPLNELARAAGFDDGERWWEHMVEHRLHEAELFPAIREAMVALRENTPQHQPGLRNHLEFLREAWMRKTIREARKEFDSVTVICGAWHSAVLDEDSLKRFKKDDDACLKGLPKVKTTTTWTPWTYEHLSSASGYGAGVTSPGWYEHLWRSPDAIIERWMTRVSRMLRKEGLDCSSAHAIEASRLAEGLASLRGRPLADLSDMADACRSIFCFDSDLAMRLIHRKVLVGERLGQVPETAPAAPLQNDLQAQQKRLRFKPEATTKTLDLDLRNETDLARSYLLHRLRMIDVPWGVPGPGGAGKGTFHELWMIRWDPVYLVRLIEYGRWGSTVAAAATAFVQHRAAETHAILELTSLLGDVLLADLPHAVEVLLYRIMNVAAAGTDVSALMEAFGPLAKSLRYGNVRQTDKEQVRQAISGILPRIVIGLPLATASLNEEAARQLEANIMEMQTGVALLEDESQQNDWLDCLDRIARTPSVHGLIQGRCARIQFDSRRWNESEISQQLSLALSHGTPPEQSAAWIEGFFRNSGLMLVHHDSLLEILDQWLSTIAADVYLNHIPLLRRTFSTFSRAERRQLAQSLSSGQTTKTQQAKPQPLDLDRERASRIIPVLKRLLNGTVSQAGGV